MKSYADLAQEIDAVEKLGKWIAISGMFGTTSESQGCVIAASCFITGIPLLQYQKENGLVKGRPYIPYDAMLAAFHKLGGKSRILRRDAEGAAIELTKDGQSREFSINWEEAQKEPFVYGGKENDIVTMLAKGKRPALKPKYATPRSRATMLFARVVSDGLRSMSPECNVGSYTPEEIEDMDEQPVLQERPVPQAPLQQDPSQPEPLQQEPPQQSPPSETSTPSSATEAAAAPQPASQTQPAGPEHNANPLPLSGPATQTHRKEILVLMHRLKDEGVTDIFDQVKAKLRAANLQALTDLTVAEADRLIRALQVKEIESWIDSAITGHKRSPGKD